MATLSPVSPLSALAGPSLSHLSSLRLPLSGTWAADVQRGCDHSLVSETCRSNSGLPETQCYSPRWRSEPLLRGHPSPSPLEIPQPLSQTDEDVGVLIPSSQWFTPLSHPPVLARLDSSHDPVKGMFQPWLTSGTEMSFGLLRGASPAPNVFCILLHPPPTQVLSSSPQARVFVC